MQKNTPEGFSITLGKGYNMTFPNGYTVSVQWGPGNYCDNYSGVFDEPIHAARSKGSWTSTDAEIGAWNSEGEWYRPNDWNDDVRGRMSPLEVLAFINEVANL